MVSHLNRDKRFMGTQLITIEVSVETTPQLSSLPGPLSRTKGGREFHLNRPGSLLQVHSLLPTPKVDMEDASSKSFT